MDIHRSAPYTEKGSKFFGYFARVESVTQFNAFMDAVKAEHKKASHYVFAYIVNEKVAGEQVSMFSDVVHKEKYFNDGEPSGCGNALLTLLKSHGVENAACIVVRYFGGILLGSGNLVRAYSTAAKLCFPNSNGV